MRKIIYFIIFLIMKSSYSSTALGQEVPITTDPATQIHPAIDGDRIVYTDYRNGASDIYLFDLSSQTETRITSDPSYQKDAKISGDKIVYHDWRNYIVGWADNDIYLLDLSTLTETRITSVQSKKENVTINGRWIAWLDWRTDVDECLTDPWGCYRRDLMMFFHDLQTNSEAPLPPWIPTFDTPWGRPSVSGDLATYKRKSGGDQAGWCDEMVINLPDDEYSSIELADLSQFPDISYTELIGGSTNASWADISGDNVIYGILEQSDIYLRVLSTGEDRMIIAGPADHARIKGDWVVFVRNGYLWYYDISTDLETQMPVGPVETYYAPSISGNRIVYTADRFGNYDIFMYEIPGPPSPEPEPTTPSLAGNDEAVSHEERVGEVFCAGLQSPWAMMGSLGVPFLAAGLIRRSRRRKY
ncbi:MAG TPA: hypothetical protein VM658_03980 [bacterium]|nr:hypothetical protein [bacterium]